ncbi:MULTISPECIES: lysozyme inhibitor LprI family protein [unclassified Pseudomonas]|uniref:lysozyme inhibitor LprI family protein n=1 Tax=unclassified Pseudomonas TaxID=196821 RepID=UPI000BCF030E|nr:MULTISPECIES: lysozyme inhibitor LprI family protein [unclassified Pseudomonas]PVZ11428.1 uncharacterized protein YecT (DUF1311 family) [Pseudomonas sp. URIL14HWK12:I12]PVZ22426.1 uncharacterized protein YecT (DUF1311 family) [Pseudomonas sp. URIL14HWK12:I10]PVZ31450.1 uncharacterized protein YecT (DUF1311 family) [Pseudomonas sp. URIL14HWK12:I11]SNZ16326.1 Uncharacterized conserved protein YecT, DUF1311 family [Pseudomonas sp. URIL14HWK12:I9]
MKSLLWVLAFISVGAYAADDDGPTPCDNVETAQQSLDCSAYNRKTAESELEDAYNGLTARISAQYGDQPKLLKDYLAKISAAQDIWRKLRTADCAVEVMEADKDANAAQTAENDCMAQRSDERSEYLQSIGTQADETDTPDN